MNENWQVDGFAEVRELGAGAQGRVVLARHTTSGTPVAIKYLSNQDAAALERLRGEAVMLGRVEHPNVVRLYRFVAGEHGAALVMEAVNGVSLKEVLAQHGALGPEAGLTVLKGSLLGLAAAHGVGVVHRDFKPANVVVQGDGLSKLIDFGVAGLAGEGAHTGTPAYMSPEQWRGEPASPATDVYSATCVFVECVTGSRPFGARDLPGLRNAHLNEQPPVDALPVPLRDLVTRGMAKDATGRPPAATSFVAELERAAVAAYGPDWEQRGIRALAGSAVALAAVFPLAAAGMAPASGAAGAAGASAGAAGSSAGAAGAGSSAGAAGGGASAGSSAFSSGGGLLTGTGAKIGAAVAGTALAVGGGTAAVLVTTGDDDRPPVVQNVAVATPLMSERTIQIPGGKRLIVNDSRYARISGHTDPAVQRRINSALRTPLNRAIEGARQAIEQNPDMGRPSQFGCPGASIAAKVHPGLRSGGLLSVRYTLDAGWVCNSDFTSQWTTTATVALDTGKALGAADILAASTLTQEGVNTLWSRVPKPKATPGDPDPCAAPARITPADLKPGGQSLADDAAVDLAFTRSGMTVSMITKGQFCGSATVTVPYERVRDLLRPDFAAKLPS